MKKTLILFVAIITLFLLSSYAGAAYIYKLDLNITNPDMIQIKKKMILGAEFIVNGGIYQDDWGYELGDIIPSGGNWIFESYGGGYCAVYDNYPTGATDDDLFPITSSGTLITITSDVQLEFSDLVIYDFFGDMIPMGGHPDHYGLAKFTLVPIPATAILFLSGIFGLVGIRKFKAGKRES